jgi:hypothetical protein
MRRSQKSGGAVAVTDARLRLGQTSRAFDPDVIHPEHKEKQAAFSKDNANSRPFSPEVVYPRPLNPRGEWELGRLRRPEVVLRGEFAPVTGL